MYNEIDWEQIDLTAKAPLEGPKRQYYFMARCRELVRKEAESLGRPLTFFVTTFGCQMNTEREIEKAA